MATITERLRKLYEKSARCLSTANRLSEKGERDKAEVWYERSAQALMQYNELSESSGVTTH